MLMLYNGPRNTAASFTTELQEPGLKGRRRLYPVN